MTANGMGTWLGSRPPVSLSSQRRGLRHAPRRRTGVSALDRTLPSFAASLCLGSLEASGPSEAASQI